ncbi:hypothetical protein NEIG_02144 [Nematocida sp. ERTm5]|nr:hypothetical protein NEIG_02144 [Nematocida sp. ERTm5]
MKVRISLLFLIQTVKVLSSLFPYNCTVMDDYEENPQSLTDEVLSHADIEDVLKLLDIDRRNMISINERVCSDETDSITESKNRIALDIYGQLVDTKDQIQISADTVTIYLRRLQELTKKVSELKSIKRSTDQNVDQEIKRANHEVHEISKLFQLELEHKEFLQKEKISQLRMAEEFRKIIRQHTETLQIILNSRKYELTRNAPPKPPRKRKEYILQFKNKYLIPLQKKKSILLNSVIEIFYQKSRNDLNKMTSQIESQLCYLLLYDYQCTHINYREKVKNFINTVKSYTIEEWDEERFCKAMDKAFLSLLILDENMSMEELKTVLAIISKLYDRNTTYVMPLSEFTEYFYSILNVHLLINCGASEEAFELTKTLFKNLQTSINIRNTRDEIHKICEVFNELNNSFMMYRYPVPYLLTCHSRNRDDNRQYWKYHRDKYSRIHQFMSVHDSAHAVPESLLLMNLHPLIHIMHDKTIPMRIIEPEDDGDVNLDVCTVEIGYAEEDSIVYLTDNVQYKDACYFCSATTINMIIDPILLNEASILIEKYVHPQATVYFKGINLKGNEAVSVSSVLYDCVHPASPNKKQFLLSCLLERLNMGRKIFLPLFSSLSVISASIFAILIDGTLFFALIPFIVFFSGIFRALFIKMGYETKTVIFAFNLISSFIIGLISLYSIDVLLRASDLTENLYLIQIIYIVLGTLSILGILSTYSKAIRRYAYSYKYTVSNLFKYSCYILGILMSLAIPVCMAAGYTELGHVLIGCNIPLFSAVFIYIACAYEKMHTQLKSDKWGRLDTIVHILACISALSALYASQVVSIECGLLDALPIIIGPKNSALSIFKDRAISYHSVFNTEKTDESHSALDKLITHIFSGITNHT